MEGNEGLCTECNEEVGDDQFFTCDSCFRKIHKDCIYLSTSESRCMPLQKRMLMLICGECKKMLARLPFIVKVLDEIRGDIRVLKERSFVPEMVVPAKSYAGALQMDADKKSNDKARNTPTLIIEPKGAQDPKQTQVELYESIRPTELKVGIKSFRSTKQGGVVIKCGSKRELEIIKEAAVKSLEGRYEMKVPELKYPRVKICGYTGKKTAAELENCIRNQNEWVGEEDKLEITYIRRGKVANAATIFAKCSPALFGKMMHFKRAYIDWERCVIYEDLTVTRCFNCQGFNHKKTSCKGKIACRNCAGGHDVSACQSENKRCQNCQSANRLYKTKYEISHAADDPSCPSYRYHVEVLKSKFDYGLING